MPFALMIYRYYMKLILGVLLSLAALLPAQAQEAAKSTAALDYSALAATFAKQYSLEPQLPQAVIITVRDNPRMIFNAVGPMGLNRVYITLMKLDPQSFTTPQKGIGAGCYVLDKLRALAISKKLMPQSDSAALTEAELTMILAAYEQGPQGLETPDSAGTAFAQKVLETMAALKVSAARQVASQKAAQDRATALQSKYDASAGVKQQRLCTACAKINPAVTENLNNYFDGSSVDMRGTGIASIPSAMGSLKTANAQSQLIQPVATPSAVAYGSSMVTAPLTDAQIASKVPAPATANQYDALIVKYAEAANLDPKLVKSWIAEESSFNPKAVSSCGARGLMQLMPATAKWMAARIGMACSDDKLFDPETNIRLGVAYVQYLFARARVLLPNVPAVGDMQLPEWIRERVIASYNAGPSVMASNNFSDGVVGYVTAITSMDGSKYITINGN